nr:hypothetical protein [uncultured Oscillibacter sp.]
MAEIIDIKNIPKKNCSTCLYFRPEMGACVCPGGYRFNWKIWKCYSWKPAQKDKEG